MNAHDRQPRVLDVVSLREMQAAESFLVTLSQEKPSRILRKLRKASPREFDALYMYCVIGMNVHLIAESLTERAIRLGKPERYDYDSVWMLLIAAVDKARKWK